MKSCVSNMILDNEKAILLLIDIGAFGFKKFMEEHPNQVKNIGIFEPGTVSIASGLSLSGMIPTIYGISPFIVQRSLEQLKLNFVYQNVGGNFITTGASYDFSKLGYSHYCPEDVETLKTLPGMEILVPGTPKQFQTLFSRCSMNDRPSYFRMTDYCNQIDVPVEFGKATLVKKGKRATVLVFAEMFDSVMEACKDLDVTILYYTTAAPFDVVTLQNNIEKGKLFICEPFYEGTFSTDIIKATKGMCVTIDEIGVPRQVLRSYGSKRDKNMQLGLTVLNIKKKLTAFLEE